MLPVAILKLGPLLASMRLVVATLPNGDVERAMFTDVPTGVQAIVERLAAATGERTIQKRLLAKGRYGWRIDEERRTVIAAVEGRPTGVIRRAFVLTAFIDATPNPNVAPHPTEAFEFHAPSREAAEALRERLKSGLSGSRPSAPRAP